MLEPDGLGCVPQEGMPSLDEVTRFGLSRDTDITISATLRHRCPVVDEWDVGEVRITYRAAVAFELHELDAWLHKFTPLRISHEALTHYIEDEFDRYTDCTTEVVTRWQTAGIEYSVATAGIDD